MSLLDRLLRKKESEERLDAAEAGDGGSPVREVAPREQGPAARASAPSAGSGQSLPRSKETPPPAAGTDLDRLREDYEQIRSLIGDRDIEEVVGKGDEEAGGVTLKLADVLPLLPERLRATDPSPGAGDREVSVPVPSLYAQLATGRISVPLSDLTDCLPPEFLSAEAAAAEDEAVSLPLPLVVASLDPEELKRRTATTEREPGIYSMPELFTPGARAAAAAAPEPEPAPAAPPSPAVPPATLPAPSVSPPEAAAPRPPALQEAAAPEEPPVAPREKAAPAAVQERALPAAIEPVGEPELPVEQGPAAAHEPAAPSSPVVPPATPPAPVVSPPEAAAPRPPAAVETRAERPAVIVPGAPPPLRESLPQPSAGAGRPDPGEFPPVMVRGMDINLEAAADLALAFPGVGPSLAARIVDGRPYRGVEDLLRVPGVGHNLFAALTGRPAPRGTGYEEGVQLVLGIGENELPPLRDVARRLAGLSTVIGCVLVHEDGYALASHGRVGDARGLSAVGPQILKSLAKYAEPIKLGELSALSLFMGGRPVSIVPGRDLHIVLVHDTARYSRRTIGIAEAVARAMERRVMSSKAAGSGGG